MAKIKPPISNSFQSNAFGIILSECFNWKTKYAGKCRSIQAQWWIGHWAPHSSRNRIMYVWLDQNRKEVRLVWNLKGKSDTISPWIAVRRKEKASDLECLFWSVSKMTLQYRIKYSLNTTNQHAGLLRRPPEVGLTQANTCWPYATKAETNHAAKLPLGSECATKY